MQIENWIAIELQSSTAASSYSSCVTDCKCNESIKYINSIEFSSHSSNILLQFQYIFEVLSLSTFYKQFHSKADYTEIQNAKHHDAFSFIWNRLKSNLFIFLVEYVFDAIREKFAWHLRACFQFYKLYINIAINRKFKAEFLKLFQEYETYTHFLINKHLQNNICLKYLKKIKIF